VVLSHAVPPPHGMTPPDGAKTCFINKKESANRAALHRSSLARKTRMAPPTNKTPKVLVARVQFSDLAMTYSRAQTETFFTNMRNFWMENSFNVFQASFTVSSGVYTLGTLASYGADVGGDVAWYDQKLFDDTMLKLNSNYVANFDQIMLYHAGNGQETSGVSNDIWSVYYPVSQSVGGKTFDGFTIVPETEASPYDPLAVICHEYGHQLGLPDVYDVSVAGGSSTAGSWSLMDYPYTGTTNPGDNPPHLDAWCKSFLGFSTPQTTTGNMTIAPAELSATGSVKLAIPTVSALEYFLVEYRYRASGASYDKAISMDGLAIWHIDDAIASDTYILSQNSVNSPNLSGRGHRGIELVESDGIGANPSTGDLGAGDAYTNGQSFTSPQSNTFAGEPSGVAIVNIAGVGTGSLSMNAAQTKASSTLDIVKIINYPNPGGNTSKYPVRTGAPAGTLTTFVLEVTRPIDEDKRRLDIYNLNGDLVKTAQGADIVLKFGNNEPTTDYKWVYEFDWNGKNTSGEAVGSGVYLYRFTANDSVKTGKVMLVK